MKNEKTLQPLKKLKSLADRGVDGEKRNAQKILSDMLEKHNLTLEDLESEDWFECRFKYTHKTKRMTAQCIRKVIGSKRDILSWSNKRILECFIECTEVEKIEIIVLIDFYTKDYQIAVDQFFTAYVLKNQIYANDSESSTSDEMTDKERQQLSRMMNSIDRKTVHKRLR